MTADGWTSADPYEYFMGRWSRLLASRFIDMIDADSDLLWLDVGCGTGALSEAILSRAQPRSLIGVDPSAAYIAAAEARNDDARATFQVGDGLALPVPAASVDEVVSGLVLNFIPNPVQAVSEMRRALRSEGRVTAYVWDYGDKMQMLRYFWDAAIALDASAGSLDEGVRFPLCREGGLSLCFEQAGLVDVQAGQIEITTTFGDFDDYWMPFLGSQGPAPSYVASLTDAARARLRDRLQSALPTEEGGSIHLVARAWVCQGTLSRQSR